MIRYEIGFFGLYCDVCEMVIDFVYMCNGYACQKEYIICAWQVCELCEEYAFMYMPSMVVCGSLA